MEQRQKRTTKSKSKPEPQHSKSKDETNPINRLPSNPKQPPTPNSASGPMSTNDPKYSKRTLISNHNKYDEDPLDDENEQLSAADFGKLLNAPAASLGNYFFFSSEKSWQTDFETPPQYFNLNLKELTKNLETIPFYLRHEYPREHFSDKEIEEMHRKSDISKDMFDKVFINNEEKVKDVPKKSETKTFEIEKPTAINSKELVENSVIDLAITEKQLNEFPEKRISEISSAEELKTNLEDSDDELDELLNFNQSKPLPLISGANLQLNVQCSVDIRTEQTVPIVAVADSKEDIQQWLDDILDD